MRWFAERVSQPFIASGLGGHLGRTALARRNARWFSGGVHIALGVGTALAGSRSAKA
jgi:hypothetical protein